MLAEFPLVGGRNGWVCVAWCLITSHVSAASGRFPSSVSKANPRNGIVSPTAKVLLCAGDVITGVGASFPASIRWVAVLVPPRPSVTVTLAVYVPAVV